MSKVIRNVLAYRDGVWKKTDILIEGNKIALVADSINVTIDAAGRETSGMQTVGDETASGEANVLTESKLVEEIDGAGMRIIPGYIDQHVHVLGGGGEGSFITQVPPLKLSDPPLAGVTTIVGVLGTDGTTRSVKNLVAKTKALKEFGLTAFCLTGNYMYPSPTLTGSVADDIVFVEEIIGVKIAICDHRSSNMSVEDLTKLASDARVAGLLSGKVGEVHLHTGSGKEKLKIIFDVLEKTDIPISVFRPTHLENKYDEAIKFAKMGGYIDFTCDPDMDWLASTVVKALEEAPEGLVTFSTDSNGSMPIWNEKKEMIGIEAGKISSLHETIKYMVKKLGCPLEKAIKPVTENVAKALNLGDRKGKIAEGFDADLVILDDELNINTVFAMGKLMVREGKLAVRVPFEKLA